MTWEDKTQMIRLFNEGNLGAAYMVFQRNLQVADHQAWDMFITILDLSPSEIKKHFEKLRVIRDFLKEEEKSNPIATGISLRSQFRLEFFKTVFDEQLNENENEQN